MNARGGAARHSSWNTLSIFALRANVASNSVAAHAFSSRLSSSVRASLEWYHIEHHFPRTKALG